ncbi:hypothetical protein [Alteromonas flava]|uniref:hypothetical protein n=1 Tax=Alteromonas flava TaxID=2048003 RepID=UPI000C281D02|nr:hypothetical protein [Alteromonas flava]
MSGRNSAPTLLIAADIFGATPALHALANKLGQGVSVIDAYEGDAPPFENESAAYEFFCQQSSVHDYATKIYYEILQNTELKHVIGFSVGASALWQCLTQHPETPVTRFFAFYGGQVRHLLPDAPRVPIDWFSASDETHFDVARLNARLQQLPNVQVHKTDYLHGFMNQHSMHFDSVGYTQYLQLMVEQLK